MERICFLKYGKKLEQSGHGSPLQRYIYQHAMQNNTEIVTPLEIIKNPIATSINVKTNNFLIVVRDSLIALEIE